MDSMLVKVRTLNVTLNANQMRHARQIRMCSSVKHRPGCWMRETIATWIYFQVCSMFTWLHVCSTQPLCRSIQSAFRRVTHQRPRRRRRRRVYFGPFRNNPENNGVDQIVTRPSDTRRSAACGLHQISPAQPPSLLQTSCSIVRASLW